jgi:hypothetical protein
VNGSR